MDGTAVKYLRDLAQHIETAEREHGPVVEEWSDSEPLGQNSTVVNLRRIAKYYDELEQEVRDYRRDMVVAEQVLKNCSFSMEHL